MHMAAAEQRSALVFSEPAKIILHGETKSPCVQTS